MDDETLAATRRSLHAVAELVIAGPQFRTVGSIELRVRPGGFGGAVVDIAVVGHELVGPQGHAALGGTCRSLASALGLEVSDLSDVYGKGSGVHPDEELTFDEDAVDRLLGWFGRGDAALRRFLPDERPVLWPEHFDVGVTAADVNYGVSPGDADHPLPYAYVGPWDAERRAELQAAEPAFWSESFGAARPESSLPDVNAVVAFFEEGRRRTASTADGQS